MQRTENQRTIVVDDDLYELIVTQAEKQGLEVNVVGNAAIRASSMHFNDLGVKYSQVDHSNEWNKFLLGEYEWSE